MIQLARSEAFDLVATLDDAGALALGASLLVLVIHAEEGIAMLLERLFP